MQKVLVTGATSFIGGYLIHELHKQGNVEIYALVRPNSPNMVRINDSGIVKVIPLDFKDVMNISDYIEKIDICYHLAWNGTRGDLRYDDILQLLNYDYSIKLYEAVKRLGCGVFIGIGSQAEYGYNQGIITEETTPNPNTEYGKYKLATCLDLSKLASHDGIRFIWGRVFSIYGKGDYENTLIMSSLKKLKNGESIDMTEGTQYWNYLYVEDLAKILVMLKDIRKAQGIINLASDDTKLLRDYILEFKSALSSSSKLNFGAIPYRKEGKVNIRPSIDKLTSLMETGFKFSRFVDVVKEL